MADIEHKPYVPADSNMREATVRALILGLAMCVVLGAANAYLGLRAGMTIAASKHSPSRPSTSARCSKCNVRPTCPGGNSTAATRSLRVRF